MAGAGSTDKDEGMQGEKQRSEEKSRKTDIRAELLLLGLKIVLLLGFLYILFQFVFAITIAPDDSMKPAVREGDIVISYRAKKDYAKDEVIIVNDKGSKQVRRVAAVAGDTVDITAKGLVVNGSLQIESEIYTDTLPFTEGISFPVTVGEGQVFVLGDNRPAAEDSRIYGPVDTSATEGTVFTTIRRRGF